MPIKFSLKQSLKYVLTAIQSKIARINIWLDKGSAPNLNEFDDLSPIDNVEHAEGYNRALEWALANKRIKNIAITGPNGSGKSSLLKTFEKSHPGYRYLNVSLASFQDQEKDMDNVEMNRLIELSILQQMFYRVKSKEVLDSRFSRIRILSTWRILLFSFFSLGFIVGAVIILFPSFLKRLSWWSKLSATYGDFLIYAALILSLPALYKLHSYVLRLLKTSKFNKINLTKGELEFDSKNETSVLNRHLDEILYFFEVTKYNVLLFEDLDRFNEPEIFTKLRELNILVNNSLQIGRHVVFIYAIKDNMFRDKTRTKFFDFIIPVIPVINWSNSYEIMMSKFGKKELNLNVSDKFINAVTLYIDDMRALKNIFNEFMLYKENLKGIALIQDKLLAIIIYKNMFPDDFAELHENKGTVYEIFQKKPDLIKAVIEKNQQLIQVNEKRITQFQERLAADVLELRAIYLLAFQRLSPNAVALNIANAYVHFHTVQTDNEHFNWFTQQDNIGIYHYVSNPSYGNYYMRQPTNSNISFKMVENLVNKELNYQQRMDLVEGQEAEEVRILNEKNQKSKQLISSFKSLSLKELFDQNSSYSSSFDDNFKDCKLLVYLVREGYIDENYPSLISYFYEGSLTYRDMAFILNIRNRGSLEFNYSLDTIHNIITRLEPEDFDRRQILNFQLIDYLLFHQGTYIDNLERVMRRLSNQSTDSLKLIEEYTQFGTEQAMFFKFLFNSWPAFWNYCYDNPTFNSDQKNKYLKLIISFSDNDQLTALNSNKKLEKYIKSVPDFLNWFNKPKQISHAKELIKLFNIKFSKIAQTGISNQLFDYVVENRFYALTEEIIRLIILEKGADEAKNGELIKKANYTAVHLSKFKPLIDYVEDNLSDYLESITLLSTDDAEDTEEHLVALLNKGNISDHIKIRLIGKEATKTQAIQTVPQSLWENLFIADKINTNWSNLVTHFSSTGTLDKTLVDYLNKRSTFEELSRHSLDADKTIDKDKAFSFEISWLQQNDLSDEAYEALLKSTSSYFPSGKPIENLSEIKVRALLNAHIIKLNPEFFELINTYFLQLVGLLIAQNFQVYVESAYDLYPLSANEFNYLLNSPLITPEKRTKIIPRITEDVLKNDTILQPLYIAEILKNDYSHSLNISLLTTAFELSQRRIRRQLVDKYFQLLSSEEIWGLLKGLGEGYSEIETKGETITLRLTDLDRSIAKKLKEAGIIADWKSKKEELFLITKNIEN